METYIDAHALFNVEPINLFHLEVSRKMNEAAKKRLKRNTKTIDNLKSYRAWFLRSKIERIPIKR